MKIQSKIFDDAHNFGILRETIFNGRENNFYQMHLISIDMSKFFHILSLVER